MNQPRLKPSISTRASGGGSAVAGERQGALLRVETPEWEGFADLHPWPELGDEPLNVHLASLATGQPTRQVLRALAAAAIDGRARRDRVSALAGLPIPTSHFLIMDVAQAGTELVSAIEQDGYRVAKIKVGREPARELDTLRRLAEDSQSLVKLRLDFNARLAAAQVLEFMRSLPAAVRERIEYLEDPCRFDEAEWKKLSQNTAPLALDRESLDPAVVAAAARGAANVLVLKPDIEDAAATLKLFIAQAPADRYAVVTSYLGHPLGQVAAARDAAELARQYPTRIGVCGLLSQLVYEPTEYSESLRHQGPQLFAPEGHGFGFDSLLAREPWQEWRS